MCSSRPPRAGCPAVAVSTALGVADAIIPGITGELALDDDPESIADAVERAASLRRRASMAGSTASPPTRAARSSREP